MPKSTTCLLSHFSYVQLCDPMDCSPSGSSVHGDAPGKNTGVDCPPPGDLPHPGIKLVTPLSPALTGGFFITSATWEAQKSTTMIKKIYKVLVKIDPRPDRKAFCVSSPHSLDE